MPITPSEVDALPLAGGAMTGAITTSSTVDGRDVAADGVKLDSLIAMRDNGNLMVRLNAVQNTTGTWATLAGWTTTPDEIGSDLTFVAATGILTVVTAGDYELTYSISGINSAGGRAGLESRLMYDATIDTYVLQTLRGAYARFDTVQQYAHTTVPNYRISLTAGLSLKIEVRDTGNSLGCTGHWHMKRVSD